MCGSHPRKKTMLLASLFLVALLIGSAPSFADAANSALQNKWLISNEENKEFIVHDPWDFFLKRFVIVNPDASGLNYIDFNGLDAKERGEIDAYIKSLESIKISDYSKTEQMAYWINLHNALVVRLISENYPVKSVKDIGTSLNPLKKDNPFDRKVTTVEGQPLSLNDIKNTVLRPTFKNPEIRYALYEGSIGSPNLQYDAYTSENLTFLLYRGASHFINHPKGVRFTDEGKLVLSSLYQENSTDFGANDTEIITHIKKYADEDLQAKLDKVNSVSEYAFNGAVNAWVEKKEAARK